jgi:pyridinium-3,5-bisthiocarboxylic acid mononucleotide nickel chelatase
MLVAALVDLGVPTSVVADALQAVDLHDYHVHFAAAERSSILATSFDVHVDGAQPYRTFRDIKTLLSASRLRPSVRELALKAFEVLAIAEARVHRVPVEEVHFHEVGAVDSIVDFVAVAACIDYLGCDVRVSTLPAGRGLKRTEHGMIPLPAPATLECLAGFSMVDAGLAFEFVTPTGAALLAAIVVDKSPEWPRMVMDRTGFGAGRARLSDRPNLVRAVLGRRLSRDVHQAHARDHDHSPDHSHDDAEPRDQASGREQAHADELQARTLAVLECNLDDMTGEMTAAALQGLLAAGALDAWATPITMKKGRPATMLSALVPIELETSLRAQFLRDTTTLGVRSTHVSRYELPRKVVEVDTRYGRVRVKVTAHGHKPEFDDCAEQARKAGVAVRDVMAEAAFEYQRSVYNLGEP